MEFLIGQIADAQVILPRFPLDRRGKDFHAAADQIRLGGVFHQVFDLQFLVATFAQGEFQWRAHRIREHAGLRFTKIAALAIKDRGTLGIAHDLDLPHLRGEWLNTLGFAEQGVDPRQHHVLFQKLPSEESAAGEQHQQGHRDIRTAASAPTLAALDPPQCIGQLRRRADLPLGDVRFADIADHPVESQPFLAILTHGQFIGQFGEIQTILAGGDFI